METTTDQKIQLASLKNNVGFQILLEIFREQIEDLQQELFTEDDDAKIVKVTREWRFYNRVLNLLQNEPELADQELREVEGYGKLLQHQLALE